MRAKVLILGGARSGKSLLAEGLAEDLSARQTDEGGSGPLYLATAQALDREMAQRVASHQARRGAPWRTVEEPLELEAALARADAPGAVILVDCLTLWLTNLLTRPGLGPREAQSLCQERGQALIDLVPLLAADLILVANEVGLGIVPDNALARAFRDLAGQLNQGLARVCGHVFFVAAGLPVALKGDAHTLPPLRC
jgi:adenosylcobinamide kinase/adenosylcobinamide-phosphate guanylyltransferase